MGQMTQATPILRGARAVELLEKVLSGKAGTAGSKQPGRTPSRLKLLDGPGQESKVFIPESLAEHHDVSGFDCGSEVLNSFLKCDALKNQTQRLSSTTIYLSGGAPAAFVTLAADVIPVEMESLRGELGTKRSQLPVLKICRLARDKRFYGCGLGERMLRDVINYAYSLSQQSPFGLGCRFVVVNARPETLGSLYYPFGFTPLQKFRKGQGRITLVYDLGARKSGNSL